MKKLQKPPKTPPTQLPFRFPLNGGGLRRNFFGFTLVELIVVIVILAILATIAFLSFNSYSSSARDSTRLADVSNLNKGVELYQVNAGYYPTPEGTISTGKVNGVDVTYKGIIGDRISKMVNINKTPVDPLSTSNYVYGISYDKKYFQIGVVLESGTNKTSFNNSIPHLTSPNLGEELISSVFPLNNGDIRGIENVYSASGAGNYFSKIKGNYNGIIKFSTGTTNKIYYIANIPSLLYNDTNPNLLNTGTYYIVNNNTNLPYQISPDTTTNNKTADVMIQEINNSPTATLTGIDITAIVNSTGTTSEINYLIASTFTGITLSSFGGNIGVVSSVVTNGASTQGSTPSSDCSLSGTTIPHGGSITAYSETSILWNASYDCTNRSITRTCNNGTLDGSGAYLYTSCTKGVVNNCSANSSYTKNGHTYSIPALNHSSGATNILSSNVSENNGTFKYTLTNIECNDGSYINSTENVTPTVQSCNSGYSLNGSSCVVLGNDSYVKLLFHADGTNNSTTFVDSESTPKTISTNGSSKISTTQSKFGGSSAYFDGTNNTYLSIPDSVDWDLPGIFTIDAWINIPADSSGVYIVGSNPYSTSTAGIVLPTWLFAERDGHVYFGYYTAQGVYPINLDQPYSFLPNQWYHIAVSRDSNSDFRIFVNGAQVGSTVNNNVAITSTLSYIGIGGVVNGSYGHYSRGYIDELRISKGIARWTSDFTPPNTQYY